MNKLVFKEIVAFLLTVPLFCLLVGTAVVVSGCEETEHKDTIEMSESDSSQTVWWNGNSMTWTYVLIRGHRYIAVRYGAGDSLTFDIDHDVDCPKCHGVSPIENQTVPESSPSSDYEVLFGKN